MRNAQMGAGRRQFARVLESDGRTEREEIHRERHQRGRPESRPIKPVEKLVLHPYSSHKIVVSIEYFLIV